MEKFSPLLMVVPGEQTQVCLDAPAALTLVPGDQRHTPDVSVLRVVAGPCVCLVYLSV